MADYHINGDQTVASPDDTTLTVERGASKRFKVFEMYSGFTLASPSDNLLSVRLHRFVTADGAGTARVPNPLDPADSACVATGLVNHTTEPTTYSTDEEVWGPIGQHMRATYRWNAAPGKEIVVANVASEGVGLVASHASVTPEHYGSLDFSE